MDPLSIWVSRPHDLFSPIVQSNAIFLSGLFFIFLSVWAMRQLYILTPNRILLVFMGEI